MLCAARITLPFLSRHRGRIDGADVERHLAGVQAPTGALSIFMYSGLPPAAWMAFIRDEIVHELGLLRVIGPLRSTAAVPDLWDRELGALVGAEGFVARRDVLGVHRLIVAMVIVSAKAE